MSELNPQTNVRVGNGIKLTISGTEAEMSASETPPFLTCEVLERNDPTVNDALHSLKRVNYFSGKVLGIDDFRAEQEYFLAKHRLHNQALHGWGVVSGLQVGVTPGDDSADEVHVEPGYALDCLGDEIVVPKAAAQPLPADGTLLYVCLQIVEAESDFVSAAGPDDILAKASRIEEVVLLTFEKTDPNVTNHLTSGIPTQDPCGTRHPVVIARLRRGPRGWRRDTRHRAVHARKP